MDTLIQAAIHLGVQLLILFLSVAATLALLRMLWQVALAIIADYGEEMLEFAIEGVLQLLVWTCRLLLWPFVALIHYLQGRTEQSSDTEEPRQTHNDVAEARKLLGVDANATAQELHAAYRRVMARVHPDVGGTDYLAVKVNEAYQLLKNTF